MKTKSPKFLCHCIISRRDIYGNCYCMVSITHLESGEYIQAAYGMCVRNIQGWAHQLGMEYVETEVMIRDFNRRSKGLPYLGDGVDGMADFINKQFQSEHNIIAGLEVYHD